MSEKKKNNTLVGIIIAVVIVGVIAVYSLASKPKLSEDEFMECFFISLISKNYSEQKRAGIIVGLPMLMERIYNKPYNEDMATKVVVKARKKYFDSKSDRYLKNSINKKCIPYERMIVNDYIEQNPLYAKTSTIEEPRGILQ